MKALRKSLNKDPHQPYISTPLPPVSRPSASTSPPQKVIRATSSYRSPTPQQLSFQQGDFFHVIREVNEGGSWFEAHNPMTGARGLVPKSMFEAFHKGAAPSRMSQFSLTSAVKSPSMQPPPSSVPKTQAFYAVVLHDFVAERPDELDAKAGDSISVVAQSNREWFVAKSIGRLGKPGLIPVSFVEVRDPATGNPILDIGALMDNGTLPRVEDWKKQMLNYKANSIALGVLDESTQPPATGTATTNPPSADPATSARASSAIPFDDQQPSLGRPQTPPLLPDGLLLSAGVVSFHFEMDEYWFRVHALYQPFDPSGSSKLPPSRNLVLYRAYNDFFDYQTALLDTFPREAGRESKYPRIIPFMPGPADDVNDILTATRQEELDDYLQRLCGLNRTTARYILEHHLTREFLSLKPGDVERDAEPQYDCMAEVGWYDPSEDPEPVPMMDPPSPIDDVVRKLQQTSINPTAGHHSDSEGSDYGDGPHSAAYPSKSAGYSQRQQSHHTASSKSKLHSTGQVPRGHSRTGNGHSISATDGVLRDSAYSRSSASSSSRRHESGSAVRSSAAGSTRSGGAHGGSAGAPAISASNPQTAYIKIKIFDRTQDDLIAIRVHPRVTHGQLLDKVQQRLGGQVAQLSYRETGEDGEDYVPLQQDDEVLWWIGSTDKHVLYAD